MKTATLDVGGMLSLLDYQAIEKQLGWIPGVQRATASVASNSVRVEYDETVTSVAALKAKINECGFHCTGQIMPKHVCEPRPVDEHGMHIGHTAHEPAAAPAAATAAVPMSHDSLVFTVPIFIYSPMGNMFTPPAPPFGLRLDLWLVFFASAAILYPAWPFVIAAIRALRNGILNMAVLVLLSVGTGYVFSVGATFFFKGDQFYEASAVLLVFVLLGHWLEMRARAGASRAIQMARCTLDKESPIQAPSLTVTVRDADGNMRSGRKNARGAGRTKNESNKVRQKWRDAPLT